MPIRHTYHNKGFRLDHSAIFGASRRRIVLFLRVFSGLAWFAGWVSGFTPRKDLFSFGFWVLLVGLVFFVFSLNPPAIFCLAGDLFGQMDVRGRVLSLHFERVIAYLGVRFAKLVSCNGFRSVTTCL